MRSVELNESCSKSINLLVETLLSPLRNLLSCRYTDNRFNVRLDVQVLQMPLLGPTSLTIRTVQGLNQNPTTVMSLNSLPWHISAAPGFGTVYQATHWIMDAGNVKVPGGNTSVAQLVSSMGQNAERYFLLVNTDSAPNGAVRGMFKRSVT